MKTMTRSWVNGNEVAAVSVFDRGLQYGDGLFETMRMQNGEIAYWSEHLARLQNGCQRLGIVINQSVIEQQFSIIASQIHSAVVKLIVTRGESERGHKVDEKQQATLIWMCSALPEYPAHYYTDGVDVTFCNTTVSRNKFLAGLKHLNRLEYVLARMEWQDEYQEGLMYDDMAHIIEGTMTNVFFVDGDILVTPDLQHCGVAGIVRQHLLDLVVREGITLQVRNVPLIELESFDSVLLSNSLIGVWPVKSISGQSCSITPLARHLVDSLRAGQY